MSNRNNESELNQLDWDAFRFSTGEMSAAEQAEFEVRLTNEPKVADAVSRMLSLEDAIDEGIGQLPISSTVPAGVSQRRASVAVPVHRVQVTGSRSTLAIAVSLIACCLAVAVVLSGTKAKPRTTVAEVSMEQAAEVLDSWLVAVETVHSSTQPEEETIELAMLEPAGRDETLAGDEVVPDWMYAAFHDSSSTEVGIE